MAVTKDGLPRKSFAYAPTAEPSTWKLPFRTKEGAPDPDHLPGAAAALSSGGFRGQKADIPAGSMPAVKAKLRAAYRQWKGADAELPDGIAEVQVLRPDGSVAVREAVVLLDKRPAYATVVFAPNGDALVVPDYDGSFYWAQQPWEAPQPSDDKAADSSWSAKWDAATATDTLKDLILLKGDEAGEPEQAAMLDKAIGAVQDFIRAETTEITAACTDCSHDPSCSCDTCPCVNSVHVVVAAESAFRAMDFLVSMREAIPQQLLAEAGKRNSGKDQARIQGMHDLAHDLGASHTKGRAYAGMSESVAPPSSAADSLTAALIEVQAGVAPEAIRFAEASYESAAVVDLREASPVFDDATRSVTITPIRPGFGNARDGFFYPAGTLREATDKGLFSGLKMFRNHPRKSDEKELPERSVTDWFAATKESTWDSERQQPRVRIQVLTEEDYGKFKAAPEHIAFSILGSGMAKPGTVNGKNARVVESFSNIRSVDWVTEAGAGGAIDFAESASEEFEMKPEDLAKMTPDQLKEAAPELYAQITGKPADAPADGAAAPAVTAEAAAPEQMPAWFAPFAAAITESQTREAARAKEASLAETKTHAAEVVTATLAESTLVAKAKDAIAAKFSDATIGEGGTHADEDALKAAVTQEAIATQALLKSIFGERPSPVGGASGQSAPEDGELTEAEKKAVAAFPGVSQKGLREAAGIAEAWGAAKPPSRQKLVFEPGEAVPWDNSQPIVGGTPMGSREADAEPESKLSEASKTVESEMASALGLN